MKNKEIVIIGYSGHSYGCLEIALNQGMSIIGYYDNEEKKINPFDLKYLGQDRVSVNIKHKPFT